ncbi:MAG: hypothetical protein PVG39_30365 [Desulfobacteraceae bacterium]|jgi:hypothetical protein
MDHKERIREMLLEAQKKSAEQVLLIKGQVPLTRDFFHKSLRNYILYKFMLEEEECTGDNLDEITEISLAKSAGISKELVQDLDIAKTCSGGSSAMTKKVLLFLAIQKDFNVYLPTEGTGNVRTLSDLSELVWNAMSEKEAWKSVLEK